MIGFIDPGARLSPSDSGPPKPPALRPWPIEGSVPGKGERLLVVEDDYFVALAVEADLLEAGYDVVAVVASGEEAIEEAVRSQPALAIVDIRLAGRLDGIETAVELRRYDIPSLFATAHSDEATRQRGMAARPVGWLTKPFKRDELLGAVERALRSSSRN